VSGTPEQTRTLIEVTVADRVATITLNRPDKRNALTDDMLEQLVGAIDRVEADDSVRVLCLRGNGSSFCSGVDLGEKLTNRGVEGAVEFGRLLDAFDRLDRHPNPTIAMLQGTSLAGGWELALHCDIRFATPDARFGMPLARLGLVVPYPAAVRLVQIAGIAATTDLLLSGELIDGSRAHALGLVTHLVAPDALHAAATSHAAKIAALAPLAVREMKRLLRHAAPAPTPEAFADFDAARRRITGSADTEEGLKAFLERRPAVFRGH
jgi:enoyl-CoA hydratase/carnithine racemase